MYKFLKNVEININVWYYFIWLQIDYKGMKMMYDLTNPKKLQSSNLLSFMITVLISINLLLIGHDMCSFTFSSEEMNFACAKVTKINQTEFTELDDKNSLTVVNFEAVLSSGNNKGKTINVIQTINSMVLPFQKKIQQGSRIIVAKSIENNDDEWSFSEYDRSMGIIWLCVAFIALIFLVGRKKGILTIISLALTATAIFYVYIPSVLSGKNIYASTAIIATFIIIMSLIIINGANAKTLCAIVGNIGGVVAAALITFFINKLLNITGILNSEYVFLETLGNVKINFPAVIWGGTVFASLGAIMNVAMSISSSMQEQSDHIKDKSYKAMVKSGMNTGRDAIGTITNTLILAYIGSSISMVILYTVNSRDLRYLFNLELIIVEIVQSIVGITGILITVPVTVIFSAKVFNRKPKNKSYC